MNRGEGWKLRGCGAVVVLAAVAVAASVGASGASGETICFEAEHANEMTLPFQIVDLLSASGGLAVSNPEGAGGRGAFWRDPGTVKYRVPVAAGGTYWAWLRVRWHGSCSNSVFVSVGNRYRPVKTKTYGKWHWRRAGPWPVKAGTATVRLRSREDGIWVDQIVLTTEPLTLRDEERKATVVPGAGEKEPPEVGVFLAAASRGLPAFPPTDFVLHHRGGATVKLDRMGCCVLRSTEATPLVVWLRNNRGTEARGKIVLEGPAGVRIEPKERAYRIPAGRALYRAEFKLSPEATLPRRRHTLYVRVHHPSGKIEGQRVRLVRPYEWLVTNAVACPKPTGLETTCELEANAAKGFPGAAGGLTWSVASEAATTPFGLLNMRRAVSDKTFVMAYAYTAVHSEAAAEALLDVRHDDMVRVWLNGEAVFSCTRQVPSVISRQLTKVKLKAGRNDVLVKICQGQNYWEFGLGFLTPDRKLTTVRGLAVAGLVKK